jgi:hypothetical protein
MDFLSKFLAKLTAALAGTPPAVDVGTKVKALYPDALYMQDIFPSSVLNVEFVVLPSVEGGLPESLKGLIQKKDGIVTVVFTGATAKSVVAVKDDREELSALLSEKLLGLTTIDEAVGNALQFLTDGYNKLMPGKDYTPAQLNKRALSMGSVLLERQDVFKNAQEFQKAVVAKFIVNGSVRFDLPDSVESKFAKLGLDKLASKNDTVAVLVKLLEAQINTVLEKALKGLKGDITVH